MFIKSKVNGLRLGFSGPPAEGVKIIVGESAIAKVWDIEPDANPSDYEYDHSALSFISSTKFNFI
jgi:hypothetical protein